ncbi:MAG: hypothetical protein ABIR56_03140, partial [Polaromonas sp.]
ATAFLIKPALIFITLNGVEPQVWRGIRARFFAFHHAFASQAGKAVVMCSSFSGLLELIIENKCMF